MSERLHTAEAMLRVMEAVDTRLDVQQILYRLVDASVAATGADRCAVLLVEGDVLVPAAVAARRPNQELFRQFKAMSSVPLGGASTDRAPLVWGDEIVVIDDARDSEIVPTAWVDIFGTTSLAIAPMSTDEGLAGLLAVEYTTTHEFAPDELAIVEAIAHTARVALGNAALRRRLAHAGAVQRQLLAGTAALGSTTDLRALLRSIAASVAELLPGSSCSISYLFDGGHAVASDAAEQRGAHRFVFPLRTSNGHQGYLTLARAEALGADELALLESFAHQAALALERAELVDQLRDRLRRAEVLHRMSDVLHGSRDLAVVLDHLNDEVCRDAGFECVEVAFRQRRHVELVGGRVVRPDEVGLLARLAADVQPATADVDLRGLRVVTVPVNGRAAGLLYARSLEPMVPLRDDEVAVLASIVSGIGEVAQRAVVDAGLREARQRIEVDEVRTKLARDLDVRLGAVLRDAAAAVDEEVERAPDDATRARLHHVRHLLSRGMMEMHATSTSAAALAVRESGLQVALRGLLTNFERRTGVLATLRSEGEPATVPPPVGECLHGVISDALDLVVEPGRGSMVSVTIRHGDEIIVTLRDDGTGLSRRTAESPGPGVLFAAGALRDRLRAIGGQLDLAAATPRGVEVVARVPLASPVRRAPFSAEART